MNRTIRSRPGMTQEEALLSLQRFARTAGEEITSFKRQGDRWVAQLQVIAEFPGDDGGDDEAPTPGKPKPNGPDDAEAPKPPKPAGEDDGEDEGPIGDDGPEGEDVSPGGPKPPKEHGKGGGEHEVVHLLHEIVQGLQDAGILKPKGIDGPAIPGSDDPLPGPPGPDGPPAPPHGGPAGPPAPPHAGPAGPGGPAGAPGAGPKGQPYGTKLKPGEVPNKPGVVPVGAPSFASVQSNSPYSMSPQQQAAPAQPGVPQQGPALSPPCPKCGGPTQGGVCPRCVSTSPQPTASVFYVQSNVRVSALEAHKELTAAYGPKGYKVTKLVPQSDGTHIAEISRV